MKWHTKHGAIQSTPQDDTAIDIRVAMADRLTDAYLESIMGLTGIGALQQNIVATSAGNKRRRFGSRVSRRLAPGLAGGSLILATVAAGWGVYTGTFGPRGFTENDTSQYLNASSPEIINLIDQDALRYTLPPEGSWNGLKSTFPKPPGYFGLQVTGLQGAVAFDSYCQWRAYWITGYEQGNQAKMAQALPVIDSFPDWSITPKVSDPGAMAMWRYVATLADAGNGVQMQRLQPLQCGGAANRP
ncbi:MAG: hypothetical protein ACYDC5_02885 [Candidatus Dormibacteria bacterium]